MKEKMLILSNALALTLLSARIDFYNRLLTELFRKKRLLFLCSPIDRHLLFLRKEFILLERRYLSAFTLTYTHL